MLKGFEERGVTGKVMSKKPHPPPLRCTGQSLEEVPKSLSPPKTLKV